MLYFAFGYRGSAFLLALYENPSNNNNSDFMEWAQLDPELVFF